MSATGNLQTFGESDRMSALPSEPDMAKSGLMHRSNRASIDHLETTTLRER